MRQSTNGGNGATSKHVTDEFRSVHSEKGKQDQNSEEVSQDKKKKLSGKESKNPRPIQTGKKDKNSKD